MRSIRRSLPLLALLLLAAAGCQDPVAPTSGGGAVAEDPFVLRDECSPRIYCPDEI